MNPKAMSITANPVILRTASLVLRLAVGGTFLLAGVTKILDPAAFALAVENYQIVPYPAAAVIAVYLPWVEIAVAAALILRKGYGGGLLLALLLCAVFLGSLGWAQARGLDIDCGCFGGGGASHNVRFALIRAAVLAAATAVLISLHKDRPAAPGVCQR